MDFNQMRGPYNEGSLASDSMMFMNNKNKGQIIGYQPRGSDQDNFNLDEY